MIQTCQKLLWYIKFVERYLSLLLFGLSQILSSNMLIWEKELPKYLTQKNVIVRTTIFTGLFALFFINIYFPFGVDHWLKQDDIQLNKIEFFLYSSLVILTGMAVIVLSRIIMYQATRNKTLSYGQYSVWIFLEITSMAAVYTIFVKFILKDIREFYDIAVLTLKNTTLVLLLPYTVLWLYFAYREKTKELEKLSSAGTASRVPTDKMIPFYDENGKLKFSVLLDDLLYLEAADNYVSIYYVSGDKVAKYMIRNTLKTLEERLEHYDIVRCHRSYLLNFNKVKILKREKEGLFLELNAPNSLTLPVSKTYVTSIVESFSEFS
jgi:hypothetical protein